ncbi:MAG: hypothetical protein K2X57_26340 [Xanthobacteraceae bacterium]|nr:hypothetical protein [Xanthobacteraceae bacterium]
MRPLIRDGGEKTASRAGESEFANSNSIHITDGFVVGDIDFSDPVQVRRALDQTTITGSLFSDEAIAAVCRAGTARELFPNIEPVEDSYQVRSLRDWIEPDAKAIMEIADLEERAWFIILHAIHGTTEELFRAIATVEDAGIVGALAQANLREPMPRTRRPWPWWYRPRVPQTSPAVGPDLFTMFVGG